MNDVNKTLYIPLYGKAFVSKKGIILADPKAEEIWARQSFPLKGKAKSKWLAYYMGMRSAVFDEWVKEKITEIPNAVVLHLGCGLDSRKLRVGAEKALWFDVDFPAVIAERKRYYQETNGYKMLTTDIRAESFIQELPQAESVILLLEGVSMYLSNQELQNILKRLNDHFPHLRILVDCYTPFAVKMSKFKNPVNEVGVSKVYGIESPNLLEENTRLTFVREHEITPSRLINELKGFEQLVFKSVYAGKTSKKLYKLYEYKS